MPFNEDPALTQINIEATTCPAELLGRIGSYFYRRNAGFKAKKVTHAEGC
jgi:hypothetical protein